jgi:hypothetical protein
MAIDTFFGFDSTDIEEQRWISRILAYRRGKATGVPIDLVKRVKCSKVGRTFVSPLASAITPNQSYSAQDLATILNNNGTIGTWTPKKVAAKLNVLGRPEKRFGTRIFTRLAAGSYTLTQPMKDAILDPNN